MSKPSASAPRPSAVSESTESTVGNRHAQNTSKGVSLPIPQVPHSPPFPPKSILQMSRPTMQSASNSSSPSSSSGSTPSSEHVALPPVTALQSRSDPSMSIPAVSSPLLEVTAPSHEHAHRTGRPRGQSTSTIRPSPAASVVRLQVETPPVSRVTSNPLPQPAQSQTVGGGRGRAISLTSRDKSAAGSRDPSTESRSRSRVKDLAKSWTTFRSASSSSSAPIPAHLHPSRASTTGDERNEDEDDKKYWWHSRAGTPRPWFEPVSPKDKQKELPVAHSSEAFPDDVSVEALQGIAPLERRGSIPAEQSESWIRTKEVHLICLQTSISMANSPPQISESIQRRRSCARVYSRRSSRRA